MVSTTPKTTRRTPARTLGKWLLLVVKIGVPLAIVAWLLGRIPPEQLRLLADRPKNWGFLGIGFLLVLLTVCASFVRWFLLVRALDLRFSLRDAFRLGFLGYMFNFVSAGGFGGDLFKAVFIAREQPRRRAEAVATVLVDRVVGLYGLLIVATLAALYQAALTTQPVIKLGDVSLTTLLLGCSACGGIVLLLMLTPGFSQWNVSRFLEHLPLIGHFTHRLLTAMRMFRQRRGMVVLILLISAGIHVASATSFYFLACGLYPSAPSWLEQLVAVPLAIVVNAVSVFTPGGFGAMELALDELYRRIPAVPTEAAGVVVALAYRISALGVATIGAVYYAIGKREVSQLMHEAAATK